MTSEYRRRQQIEAEARWQAAELRRLVRGIGKADLTKSEKLILERIVNLWLAHRYKEGVIRPGRSRLAKLCDVHVNTVKTTLGKLRALGVICPVAYAKGGRNATRYTVNLDVLKHRFGGPLPLVAPGELALVRGSKLSGSEIGNCPLAPDKNCPRIYTHQDSVEVHGQDLPEAGRVIPLRRRGGGDV